MEFTKETIEEFEKIIGKSLKEDQDRRRKTNTLISVNQIMESYIGLLEEKLKVIIQEKNLWKESANKHQ